MSVTTSIRKDAETIQNMIAEGRALEAFEQYYADDVIMQENDNPPTEGKAANHQRELDFFGGVTEFRGFELKSLAVDEENQTVLVESVYDYTHKDYGSLKYTQATVQRWREGKVVSERFYFYPAAA